MTHPEAPLDAWSVPVTVISTRTYPSGAKASVIEIAGHRAGLLQLPYHEGDIYDLLMADPPPKPEGESQ